jgi:hypothetical protein
MVKQKFSGGQRFCAAEKFFGASGDALSSFSQSRTTYLHACTPTRKRLYRLPHSRDHRPIAKMPLSPSFKNRLSATK